MNDQLIDYRDQVISAINSIKLDKIFALANEISRTRLESNFIYIAGNGGSAATAEHMATDLMLNTKFQKLPIRVICLSSNSASILATGNDVNFESVFSKQLTNLGKEGDLLIVISASGNSPNLLNVVATAKELKMRTVGILGFNGGELIKLVDHAVHVQTEIGAYGVAEDLHLMINHMLVLELRKDQKTID
jgi:D-sedoheptulose 7-phosphate isomerase